MSSSKDSDNGSGVLPSPCFPNFLARTTFVLESLSEAKNPGQDAFWGILSLTVVILDIKAYSLSQIVIISENKPMHKKYKNYNVLK